MNALDNRIQASTVKLNYTSNDVQHFVQISCKESFAVLSQTGKYFTESVKTRKKKIKIEFK